MTATYFIEKVIISFAVPFTIISVIFGIVSPQTIAGIEYTVAGVVSRILLFGITALILYFATKRGASVVKVRKKHFILYSRMQSWLIHNR